ncbi:MAG: DedA family protein [Bdellovibrionales bacterium]|nr:DedA family protein [Bdellovibrionales bacterium]
MEQAREFLTQFSGPEGYLAFYLVLVSCGMGAPLNSDLILITASILAALGFFKLPILIPIAFFGLLTGDSVNFFIARRFGPAILRKAPFRWILSETRVKRAEELLQKRGRSLLFCIRFLPFVRTALFFTAGSLQISPKAFYLLNGISTVIYLSLLMNLSFAAGANIEFLIAVFKKIQLVILIFVVSVAFLLLRGSRKKRGTAS